MIAATTSSQPDCWSALPEQIDPPDISAIVAEVTAGWGVDPSSVALVIVGDQS